jgi:hypothetical protein
VVGFSNPLTEGFRQVPLGFREGGEFRGRDFDRFGDRDFRRPFFGHEEEEEHEFPFFLNFGTPFYGGYPYSYPYNYPAPYCDIYGNCYYPPAYRNPRLNVVIPLHF